MANKVRINLANEQELMELPGIGRTQAAAIVRHRSQHGPIEGPEALATVLGGGPLADSTRARAKPRRARPRTARREGMAGQELPGLDARARPRSDPHGAHCRRHHRGL